MADSDRHHPVGRVALSDVLSTASVERYPLPPAELPNSLRDAFSTLETRDPQLGTDWLSNLATQALDPGDEAFILVANGAGGSIAALPLRMTASRKISALATFYTTTYAPLLVGPDSDALLRTLLRYIAETLRPRELVLSPIDSNEAHFTRLRDALSATGWLGVHEFDCFANWTHDLAGTNWDTYLAQRPSRVRNTVNRRSRRFEREGGTLRLIRAGEQLDAAIEDFIEIYNASWKQPEPYPAFMPALLRLAAERGWLRLALADYGGEAIAAQAWLVAGRTAYIYKLAYRQGFEQLSPGTVLTAYLMQEVIDKDGVATLDYLSGDDDYKRDWMSHRGERRGLAAYNGLTVRGRLSAIARTISRSWLRR